jgi:4-amino-4-deoxy-L-arabinose transferase-like glycosyltransferase
MAKRRKPPHSPKPIHPHRSSRPRTPERRSTLNLTTALTPWLFILLALALAAIPFCLGRYFEFNSPGPFDSSAYVYSAQHILEGAQIGVEEKTSAQAGTLLVNMLGVALCGFSETGPKLMQTLFMAAALLLMFFSLRKLFGLLPAAVAILITAVYLSSPIMIKFGNVKEQFMIALMVMGVSCFVFRQLGGRWWWTLLAGVFLAWAPLFKQTGVSALAAVGIFTLAQLLFKHRPLKQTGLDILLLLVAWLAFCVAPICIWMDAVDARVGRPYQFVWQTPYQFVCQRLGLKSSPAQPAPSTAPSPTPDTTKPDTATADTSSPPSSAEPQKKSKSYIARSRELHSFTRQRPTVMRFYGVLILPIALAFGALVVRIVRIFTRHGKENPAETKSEYDRFVLLFAVWWLLDMAFVWISPRSYEQYYLPLNASAAMLGAYLIARYRHKLNTSPNRPAWIGVGAVGVICMIIMAWHIFFGLKTSPHTGNPYPEKRNGLFSKYQEIKNQKKQRELLNEYVRNHQWNIVQEFMRAGSWEAIAKYINSNSSKTDTIYVWGWFPGIYVQAQRLSSSPYAFESEMHSSAPSSLAGRIKAVVRALEKNPPRFIVDSQKMHFPFFEHPVFDLWPRWRDRQNDEFDLRPYIKRPPAAEKVSFITIAEEEKFHELLNQYVEAYCIRQLTAENRQGGPLTKENARQRAQTEIARHQAMRPLRQFVMTHYRPVNPADSSMFVFELKSTPQPATDGG